MENIYDDYNLYIFIVIILVLIEFIKCNKKYNGYLLRLKEGIGIKWIWLLIGIYLLKYHFIIRHMIFLHLYDMLLNYWEMDM